MDDQFLYSDPTAALQYMHQNTNQLKQLSNDACFKSYGQDFITDWANVLIVVDDPPSYNESLLNVIENLSEDSGTWVCNGPVGGATFCQNPQDVSNAADWVVPVSLASDDSWDCGISVNATLPAKYCLAQPTQEACRIGVIPSLLIIVLICNIIKIVCLVWTITRLRIEPLVTLGDAISSFLDRPDPTTRGCGAMSASDIKSWNSTLHPFSGAGASTVWKAKAKNGFAAASTKRWLACNFL